MTKATHNGTCQCCGRVQALTPNGIAKHGYTTEYGFFNGTCRGSDNQPLELDTALNVATVAGLREWAADRKAEAEGDITEVPVTVRELRRDGSRRERTVMMDRVAFEAKHPAYTKFDDAVARRRVTLARMAEQAVAQARELADLATLVHGNPLQEREAEKPLQRTSAKSYREACEKVRELQAAGKQDVRQRRRPFNQGGGFAITYRD